MRGAAIAISARARPPDADLVDGDIGAVGGVIPGLTEALETAKGFHQFLWAIRLLAARAEASRLAGRHEEAISFARTALIEAERFGRRKYDCIVRVPLARALSTTGRPGLTDAHRAILLDRPDVAALMSEVRVRLVVVRTVRDDEHGGRRGVGTDHGNIQASGGTR